MTGIITFTNPPALAPSPGYSQVAEIRGGRLILVAGQVALDREGAIVGIGDLGAQAEQVFDNLRAALAAVGATPADVAKLTVFTCDMPAIAAYRPARDRFFAGSTPPVITLVEVSRLFRDGLLLEIEAVAARP
ncbi:MAG TPA: RidA family protein [Stellaceae bacterium]|nr:RidA family protein [Stellaceae bacterium]